MATISIELSDEELRQALANLVTTLTSQGTRPAMLAIGDALVSSTRARFSAGVTPAGAPWTGLSPVTKAIRQRKQARGNNVIAGNKPLVESGRLARNSLTHQVSSEGNAVSVGIDRFGDGRIGAALHFGTDRAGRGHKVSIPPRPFLGISDSDRNQVLDIIRTALLRPAG
ncbi:MAG: phage virion morphogenesis protein [Azoarcus sp.]|jgi:phage virion morphogenesis protein|nr:phage virion morphogenesis protein [Azoarcus sp.]